jgi:hypothetical protein
MNFLKIKGLKNTSKGVLETNEKALENPIPLTVGEK